MSIIFFGKLFSKELKITFKHLRLLFFFKEMQRRFKDSNNF